MQVSQYLFQSPSSSQVQIGRPDPSVKTESAPTQSATVANESLSKAQSFTATQTTEVTPQVESTESTHLLDVYA